MTYEQSIHERVWALYQAFKAPGAVLFHIANEGIRGPRERAKFKAMGGVAGVPDFQWMARGRVGFLEMKRAKGKVSAEQRDFIGAAYAQGVTTHVAYSAIEAAEFLQSTGVLRADVKFTVLGDPTADVGAQDGSGVLVPGPSIQFTKEAATAA